MIWPAWPGMPCGFRQSFGSEAPGMIEPIMFFRHRLPGGEPYRARPHSARAAPRRSSYHGRLEAATPLSMAEIQADKDQLRAEFAMSTRRLETSVEQMKSQDHQPARRARQEDRHHQPPEDRARREDRRDLRAGSAREGAERSAADHRERILGEDRRAARGRARAHRQAGRARQAQPRLDERSMHSDSQRIEWSRCARRSTR